MEHLLKFQRQNMWRAPNPLISNIPQHMPPADKIDASRENATRTSSHNTRRETVTAHTPPTHVTYDFRLIFLLPNCTVFSYTINKPIKKIKMLQAFDTQKPFPSLLHLFFQVFIFQPLPRIDDILCLINEISYNY